MYSELPLWVSILFILGGFVALAWSSDVFVDGSAAIARVLGISPFIIGMVIIGFGTSAPELCVSVMSGVSGHSNVSLGNAYGSCVFNIAGILAVAALIRPILVKPAISFVAVPALLGVTAVSYYLLADGICTRAESFLLLALFAVIMPLYCWYDQKASGETPATSATAEAQQPAPKVWLALVKLVVGLAVLVGSSHILVWGSVDLARAMGVSELVIGLTIVAIGTSLPELASAVASARKGEHEFVLGNIVGSNLFNTLAVVGLASTISPIQNFSAYILARDLPIMFGAVLSIAVFGINYKKPRQGGRINRLEGVFWILFFVAYTILLFLQETRS